MKRFFVNNYHTISNLLVSNMLTRGGDVNNTFFINNNKINDYENASFDTSCFGSLSSSVGEAKN